MKILIGLKQLACLLWGLSMSELEKMGWDVWMKEYRKYFSEHWLVAIDVLQESGQPPPQVRFVVGLKHEDGTILYYNPHGTRNYKGDWRHSIEIAKIYLSEFKAKTSNATVSYRKYALQSDTDIKTLELIYIPCITIPLLNEANNDLG